jgi:nucleoside-diphosphate-sugar epimerase
VLPEALGATLNLCTGEPFSVREVVETVLALTESSATPDFGALPYRDSEAWLLSGDPRRARELLGWSARTPLREGLERTIRWHLAHESQRVAAG